MAQRHPDIGNAVGLSVSAVGLGIGALLYSAHERGMEAVRAGREARAQAAYDAAVDHALDNGEQLGRLARQLAAELAEARAENVKLRRALAQRQAYIDRLRRAS